MELRQISDQPLERTNTILKQVKTNGRQDGERNWMYQKFSSYFCASFFSELRDGEMRSEKRVDLHLETQTEGACESCDEVVVDKDERLCLVCRTGVFERLLRTGNLFVVEEEDSLASFSEEEEEEE